MALSGSLARRFQFESVFHLKQMFRLFKKTGALYFCELCIFPPKFLTEKITEIDPSSIYATDFRHFLFKIMGKNKNTSLLLRSLSLNANKILIES